MYHIFETNLMNKAFAKIPLEFPSDVAAVNYINRNIWRRHLSLNDAERTVIKEVGGNGKQYMLYHDKQCLFRYDVVNAILPGSP